MPGDVRAVHMPDDDTDDEPLQTIPFRIAEFLDELPTAPHRLAKKVLHWQGERQDRISAQRSVRWRQLRYRGPDDLRELDDMFEMVDLEHRLAPDPFFVLWARRLQYVSAYTVVRDLKGYRDLLVRGWRDSDVWNLGDTNMERLGEQLLYLADIAHGWPGTEEFPTFEDWEEALVFHGTVLATLTEERSIDRAHAMHTWSELHRVDRDKEAIKAAWEEMQRIEQDEHELLEASLIWFAQHYRQLWD